MALGTKTCGARRENAKKRAVIAMARKLAVLLHRLWVGGECTNHCATATKRCVPWPRVNSSHKTWEARGRRSWRSSFLGDPGWKSLCEKLERQEERTGAKEAGREMVSKQSELDRRDQVTATGL